MPKKEKIDPETGEVTMSEDQAPAFDPRLESLRGDLRDAMLMRIRDLRKPWAQMAEADQSDVINGVDLAAKDIIRKTVALFTGYEWPHAAVTLGEVKIKGEKGLEAKITCPNIALYREVLGDAVGEQVMILMVDSETFMDERGPACAMPDQGDLPLEEERKPETDKGKLLPPPSPEV
ncbi:hypothetical protein [Cereibacter sphaeroides]|jgi:hypothetical protein|uniref:hypothetical protein n=1 Tax=Cereibacter sphaeroides TaxID=1063 RepID=UPI00006640BE|nr:hypothetical protein Rsph17029_0663 [Cereibacter sphaeroides ATCC 17029]